MNYYVLAVAYSTTKADNFGRRIIGDSEYANLVIESDSFVNLNEVTKQMKALNSDVKNVTILSINKVIAEEARMFAENMAKEVGFGASLVFLPSLVKKRNTEEPRRKVNKEPTPVGKEEGDEPDDADNAVDDSKKS